MTGPRTAIFRVDAAPAIGGGHAMRCLTLADALAEAGWTCGFAVREGTLETVPALGRSRHAVRTLEGKEGDEPSALAGHWAGGADWLIVDHYGRDARFERDCRPWARRIMAIDDLADRPHGCDLLLDQTLERREADYLGLVPEGRQFLLGPRYALLRPAFAAIRQTALARRRAEGPVRRILISLGAADAANVTGRVLEGIALSDIDAEVDVVLGAGAPHLNTVKALAGRLPQRIELHVDTPDMAGLMTRADIAVGAAGSTSWERCCLGLPTLLLVLADNQREAARRLIAAGAAAPLGDPGDIPRNGLQSAVMRFVEDRAQCRSISQAAASFTDGEGTARVLDMLRVAA